MRRTRRSGRRLVWAAVAVVIVVGAFAAWGAFRRGPAPAVELTADRTAVGPGTNVEAHFSEPSWGLGTVRLEVKQGDRVQVLATQSFRRAGPWSPTKGPSTPEATLKGEVGIHAEPWLKEGEVVVRAVADRMAGPLRPTHAVVAEKRYPVRLRPPSLELLSRGNYVRQGGSGVVVFRVGEEATVSGVEAGKAISRSFAMPHGTRGERFCLYAVPWDLSDGGAVKLFAEDAAGNRAELAFLDLFHKAPPTRDTIKVSDSFLERVVPAIASQEPGFDASGPLIDQYLRINGPMREATLARLHKMAAQTVESFLWKGAFKQLPNSARRAGFAEERTYLYEGKVVDHETHLGLDLASTAHAAVPAANSGRVVYAGWLTIYGNAVVLDHGYGLMSLYGHMSSISVKEGQMVEKGEELGRSGETGLAGGDHLHLEIFVQGESVNPMEWLDAHWIASNIGNKLRLP